MTWKDYILFNDYHHAPWVPQDVAVEVSLESDPFSTGQHPKQSTNELSGPNSNSGNTTSTAASTNQSCSSTPENRLAENLLEVHRGHFLLNAEAVRVPNAEDGLFRFITSRVMKPKKRVASTSCDSDEPNTKKAKMARRMRALTLLAQKRPLVAHEETNIKRLKTQPEPSRKTCMFLHDVSLEEVEAMSLA
eukprot:Filipodium_phascolosomae@DN4604_c0_g1_i1.p1